VQWHRLFDALSSPRAHDALAHLGLRSSDGPAIAAVAGRAAASLHRILAETEGAAALVQVNEVLAASYAELERHGARLARAVFALASDGFPGPVERAQIAAWDTALRALRGSRLGAVMLSPAKREVLVALLGHYLAATEALASPAAGRRPSPELEWLLGLARWRRFASVRRALGKVLTPGERQRILAG
jgi:hypothetical protein